MTSGGPYPALSGEIVNTAATTTYANVLAADRARAVAISVSNEVRFVFAGSTAPTNDTGAMIMTAHANPMIVEVPAGLNMWMRANSGNQRVSLMLVDPVDPPNGPKTFTVERASGTSATVKWEPSDWGTRPTGVQLRYRRRNGGDTGWGSWSNVTGEDFASGEDTITGLTAGARRYQVGLIFTANSGNSDETYAEVRI